MLDLVSRALTLVPPDSHYAGRLLSRYGQVVGLQESDYEAARDSFERALAIAQREGDAPLEMRTFAAAASVNTIHARYENGLRNSLNAIRLSDRVNDVRSLLNARYCAVTCLLVQGNEINFMS